MSAAANSQCEMIFTREVDALDHISHIDASGNERGMLVDHAVVKAARLVIIVIARTHHFSTQTRLKGLGLSLAERTRIYSFFDNHNIYSSQKHYSKILPPYKML